MHCVRFEMRLNQLLDDRAAPDSDLELVEHARECPDCGELLTGHELLLGGIALLDEPAALQSAGSPDFAVRVAAAVAGGSRRSFWQNWIWSVPAVAAGLLVAFGLWHGFGGAGSTNRPPNGSLVKDPPKVVPSRIAVDTNDRYRRLYAQTEAELRQRFGGRPPEWVDQMADGLKPVADSMSAALHALRRTLPGGDPAVRSSQFEPLPLFRVAAIA